MSNFKKLIEAVNNVRRDAYSIVRRQDTYPGDASVHLTYSAILGYGLSLPAFDLIRKEFESGLKAEMDKIMKAIGTDAVLQESQWNKESRLDFESKSIYRSMNIQAKSDVVADKISEKLVKLGYVKPVQHDVK